MVFRYIIIFTLITINFGNTKIIYDKFDVTISQIELNVYKELHLENNGFSLNDNQAIKKLVLLKKTVNFLIYNNTEYMDLLDERIKNEFGGNVFNEKITLDFIRFQKIRSEFISEYFQNNFNLKDLELIFLSISELKLPLSKNNCLTIEKLYEAKNDKQFMISFFENLKGVKKKFKTKIDNINYDICINDKLFNELELLVIKYIELKTEKDFSKFIYGKID